MVLRLFQIAFLLLVISKIEAAKYGGHCNITESCTDPAQICVATICICDAGYIHVIGGCVSSKYVSHFVNFPNSMSEIYLSQIIQNLKVLPLALHQSILPCASL